jgi:hypothetical protein
MSTTQTDTVMTVADFNRKVQDWTNQIRRKALRRLQDATTGKTSGKGRRSLKPSRKYDYGEVYSTGFKFAYYLVFLHYGVGKGYIRQNGTVVRGHKDKRFKNKFGHMAYTNDTRPIARQATDWIDVEIREGIDRLADIAQEYHGDKAAMDVLNQKHKLLIDKQ